MKMKKRAIYNNFKFYNNFKKAKSEVKLITF